MADPLGNLQNMSKEPGLGERSKIEKDNMEYQKQGQNFSAQKQNLKNTLYGNFNAEKKPEEKQKVEIDQKYEIDFDIDPLASLIETSKEKENKIDETNQEQNLADIETNQENIVESDSPYLPMLKSLNEAGHIDNETMIEASIELSKLDNQEGEKEFLSLVSGVSDAKLREKILNKFENSEEIDETNFEESEFFKDKSNLVLDKGVGGLELMLAENYISVPYIDGQKNKNKDILSTMDITTNALIAKNSKSFRDQNGELISKIREESNINKKYVLLKELYKGNLKTDAKAGGKKSKEEIRKKQESLKIKFEKINWEMEKTNKITNNEEKAQKLKVLKKEKEQIITEGKDLDVFERETILIGYGLTLDEGIISGGKEDKQNEGNEKEQQA